MSDFDVAIIGGGIVGSSTAYYLSMHAIRSVILEPEEIAAKASGLAYGGIVEISGFAVPGAMWELGQYAADLHSGLRKSLEEDSGIDCKYRGRDTLNLAFSTKETALLRERTRWINHSTSVRAEFLDQAQALHLEPRLNPNVFGAALMQGTREVDPKRLTTALVQVSQCDWLRKRVNSLQANKSGIDLSLDDGSNLTARVVVCANGTWVTPLLESISLDVPVPPLKGEILRLETEGPPLVQSIGWNGNYCTTKTDGLTWAGTTETNAGFDETTTEGGRKEILGNLEFVLPDLVVRRIARQTACLRPTTPDGLPYIGQIPGHANVFVGTGAGRKGILYGPAMGKVIADLIAAKDLEIDVDPFAISRAARTHNLRKL